MRPAAAYEANWFLKDHNKFYSDVLINEDLSSDEIIKFLNEEQNENVVERSEEEEHDTCQNHCTSSNETALISEVPNYSRKWKSYYSYKSRENTNFSF